MCLYCIESLTSEVTLVQNLASEFPVIDFKRKFESKILWLEPLLLR